MHETSINLANSNTADEFNQDKGCLAHRSIHFYLFGFEKCHESVATFTFVHEIDTIFIKFLILIIRLLMAKEIRIDADILLS